jgi:hypothetical protein
MRGHGKQALERENNALKLENAALRKALLEEWGTNYAEHCHRGDEWPHSPSWACYCGWPQPDVLKRSAPSAAPHVGGAIEPLE